MDCRLMPDEIETYALRELKTFVPRDFRDDHVLLRCRCGQGDVWFRIHREDFPRLADYLADEARQLKAN
jgi:hypothetical protein